MKHIGFDIKHITFFCGFDRGRNPYLISVFFPEKDFLMDGSPLFFLSFNAAFFSKLGGLDPLKLGLVGGWVIYKVRAPNILDYFLEFCCITSVIQGISLNG